MTNLKKLLGSGVITSALTLSALSPAFAVDVTIDHNGAGSHNDVDITSHSHCTITQSNTTVVTNTTNVKQKTGGNTASGNTGGDTSIDTGNTNSTVKNTVGGSTNTIGSDPCCCAAPLSPDVTISGNGANSHNDVDLHSGHWGTKTQTNVNVSTLLTRVRQKTGKNKANNNTGGTTDVTTGSTTSNVSNSVTGSTNN